MKLCPMVVQGLWEYKSPLLQLPYINEENMKHFMSKRRQIKSLQQFAQLKGEERRNLLRTLTDDEYENVMKVLGRMPYVDFQIQVEGKITIPRYVWYSVMINFFSDGR